MLRKIINLFKPAPAVDYNELLSKGAIIIDVRSAAEYKSGHIKKSKNIPLQQLNSKLDSLNKSKPIITCCASGMRSGTARAILKRNGFEVYNGGGWRSLDSKLS